MGEESYACHWRLDAGSLPPNVLITLLSIRLTTLNHAPYVPSALVLCTPWPKYSSG